MDRASTSLMQKAGAIEKTIDKEFEDQERRFKTFEQRTCHLQKEAKGYLDALRSMTVAQQRIADTINQFYDETSVMAGTGLKFKELASQLDEQVRTAMDQEYRVTVLEPLGRLTAYFPDVNEAMKRRQKKLLDHDSMRAKVRKLVEHPSSDADKLPRAERQAQESKEVYENINRQLIEDLPKFVDLRIPYLDPSFEALMRCQLKFVREAHGKMEELKRHVGAQYKYDDAQIEGVLQQMRDLSIVGHS